MSLKHQKLCKQADKCDDKQQFKDILEAAKFYTPEGFTKNSPISSMKQTPVKKPSAHKSLCMFTNILDVNKKLLTVKLEMLNLSGRQLIQELHHGH